MSCVKSILINKDGVLQNPNDNNLPLLNGANGILFNNEISLTFYNEIETDPATKLKVPKKSSVVKTGLSGTVEISALPEEDSPYSVPLDTATIDISTSCWLGFKGLATQILATCTGVTGANYINITVYRS